MHSYHVQSIIANYFGIDPNKKLGSANRDLDYKKYLSAAIFFLHTFCNFYDARIMGALDISNTTLAKYKERFIFNEDARKLKIILNKYKETL